MSPQTLPHYPVYIVSKGRYDKKGLTARLFLRDRVPFHVVVEPPEADHYAVAFGAEHVLTLPFGNLGQGSIPARNWAWEHARAAGHARHWMLDDNIGGMRRWFGGQRVPCVAGVALAATEDLVDRYENVAIGGLNYYKWAHTGGQQPHDPFWLNVHVYSCMLIDNSLPCRWRGRYNEDTDLCLQVLAAGHCTLALNAFMADKVATMTMKGGNTDQLYQGDGRLKMARSLERMWPGVVTVSRRYNRPQHVVNWKRFDTPLRLKPGVDLAALPAVNEYGMKLVQVAPTVKSAALRALLADQEQGAATT